MRNDRNLLLAYVSDVSLLGENMNTYHKEQKLKYDSVNPEINAGRTKHMVISPGEDAGRYHNIKMWQKPNTRKEIQHMQPVIIDGL
jgi:hypothetical protein